MRAVKVQAVRHFFIEAYRDPGLVPREHLNRAYRRVKKAIREGTSVEHDVILSFLRPPAKRSAATPARVRHRVSGIRKRRERANALRDGNA